MAEHVLFRKPHKIEPATYLGSVPGYSGATYCRRCGHVLNSKPGSMGYRHSKDKVPNY